MFQLANLTLLAVPGIALLIALRLLGRGRPTEDSLTQGLFVGGVAMCTLAAFALAISATAVAAVVFVPIILFTLVGVYVRQRRGDDGALLSGFALAAEEGIPLLDTARAFTAERGDSRTSLVGKSLAAGQPLRVALQRGGVKVPPAARAVLSFAEERGPLGPLLRRALEPLRTLDAAITLALNRLSLWIFALAVWAAVNLFMAHRILRILQIMLQELDAESWGALEASLRVFRDYRFQVALGILILLPLIGIALRQCGLSFRRPYVAWLWLRYDSAVLLHALAAGLRSSVPLPELLQSIAGNHDTPLVSRRLQKVADEIRRGGATWDAFRRQGFLTPSEGAALRAAEPCDHVAPVLDELSTAIIRRLEYRLRRWVAILYPIGLAVLGGLVTFSALLVFQPLIRLVFALA